MSGALVVGASGSIGSAVAGLLEEGGWDVVRSSSREAPGEGWVRIDLTEPGSLREAAAGLPELDGVVVCAGIEPQRSLEETDAEHVGLMLDLNLRGPILLLQALSERLRDGAAVVLLSSVAAYKGSYDPAYAAAKGGVSALARSLAGQLSPSVRVNALAPGLVEGTPVYDGMTEDFREKHRSSTPLGGLATPRDCAEAVRFLLEQPRLTGVTLHMNGGQYFG